MTGRKLLKDAIRILASDCDAVLFCDLWSTPISGQAIFCCTPDKGQEALEIRWINLMLRLIQVRALLHSPIVKTCLTLTPTRISRDFPTPSALAEAVP